MKRGLVVFLWMICAQVPAAPNSATVVSGDVTIDQAGQGTTIQQATQEAWIDWASFSVGSDEWVHFQQALENGLTVNRVTGTDLSEIMGAITSNGAVYLVNPNGILFGENAHVDVGALFATDHWLEPNGVLSAPSSSSKGIEVLGTLTSREDLTLLANAISNAGHLEGDNVSMLSNQGALLHLDDQGLVSVLVPATDAHSSWVENTGAIKANDQLYLGSAHVNDWLNTLAEEQQVSVSGSLEAQTITVQGASVTLDSAELTAGLIDIESKSKTNIGSSNLTAVDGNIRVRGDEIQLYNGSQINIGAGELTVGGYFQGQSDDHNAELVYVSHSVEIFGNGGETNDGGYIIFWSDGHTEFRGNIEAKGGSASGNGGFVEVSGKETLGFAGFVDATAANGDMGELLLDPTTITIETGNGTGTGSSADDAGVADGLFDDADNVNASFINEDTLEALATVNLTLQAKNGITIQALFDDELTLSQTGTVRFELTGGATNSNAGITMLDTTDTINLTGGGNLEFYIDEDSYGLGFTNSITVGDINMAGGNVLFDIDATPQISNDIENQSLTVGNIVNTGNGDVIVDLDATGNDRNTGDISITMGDISINGTADANLVQIFGRTNSTGTGNSGNVTADIGTITVAGNGGAFSGVDIDLVSSGGSGTSGTTTLDLNDDITVTSSSGTSHEVDILLQEDASAGGTLNSYGDIFANSGQITLASGTWELLDADGLVQLNSMSNFSGGGSGVDLTAFSAGSIDGNGNSLTIAGSGSHNLDWDEFTNLNFLFYRTDGDVELGVDGVKDISNTELALIDASANRLTVQAAGNITTTNAVVATQLALRADRDDNGVGSVILNGLNTTNTNLTLSGADISGNGTATNTGTGTLTIDTNGALVDISIGNAGTSSYNVEQTVWDSFNASTITVEASTGGTIYWENSTLGGDVVLDASIGAGVEFQNGPFTFAGANTLQTIGDTYIESNLTMSNVSSSFDVDGDLYIGDTNAAGGQSVALSGVLDTAGITSVTLLGDTGDTATISHIGSGDLSLQAISSPNGNPDININSTRGVTTNGIDANDVTVTLDTDANSVDSWTSNGTNSVNDVSVVGQFNEDWNVNGSWTVTGDVSVTNMRDSFININSWTANSFNFSSSNSIVFGSGSAHTMTSTGGNIVLSDISSDRNVNFRSDGTITTQAVVTLNDNVSFRADDVTGDGSSLNVGTGRITFQVNSGVNNISVGDAGVDTYTIEANIWDNISAGEISLDAIGSNDTIAFLEDTLPADLVIDGPDGSLIFAGGTAQNFVGATINTNTDVLFTQNFTSDSALDIDGNISIGATNAAGGDSISISAPLWFSGVTDVQLLGDTGDTVSLTSINTTGLNLADISTPNGDVDLSVTAAAGINLNGFEGGDLTLNIDADNNAAEVITTVGTYTANDVLITGTGGNDSATLGGNWNLTGDLTLALDANITDTINASNLSTSGSMTLTDATLTLDAFDSSAWSDITLAGSNNSITTTVGNLALDGAFGTSANLTLDSAGTLSVNDSSGGLLTLNDAASLGGNLTFSNIASASDLTFTDATISLTEFDNTDYASVAFLGSQNEITVNGGDLILDNVTYATDSDFSANVGAGNHRINNSELGTGDISISGVNGTSNQNLTAEGDWTYAELTIDGIDTLTNNADLFGTGLTDISVTDDIILNDGSTIESDRVELAADDDITITGVTARSDDIPSVVIRAGGDLLDGGDTNTDIDTVWREAIEYDVDGSRDELESEFDLALDLDVITDGVAAVSDPTAVVIVDDAESTNPVESVQASVGSLPKQRLDVFMPECTGNNKDCRKTNAIRKFLSALLIGGALPE